jgi:glycosyltransferase involved in cell wall biosynthesis
VAVRIQGTAETEWALWRKHWLIMLKRPATRMFFRRVRVIFTTNRYHLGFVRTFYLRRNPLRAARKRFGMAPQVVPSREERPDLVPPHIARIVEDPAVISFLSSGRLDFHGELQKNFGRLLSGFALARKSLRDRPLRLVLVGDGDQRPKLERQAEQLGLAEDVVFAPKLPPGAIRHLQSRVDAVLQPSMFEGQPMFAVEALEVGAPLLVSPVAGLIEVVEDGENGLFVDPLDPYDIAAKLERFVTEMLPRLPEVRAASAARFQTMFHPERTATRLVEQLRLIQAEFDSKR